jgi:iron complex outermembrane receptor protein
MILRLPSLFAFLTLFVLAGVAIAQEYTVQGRVQSDRGEPLAGANIVVKGTRQGTRTDLEGRYRISYSRPDAILVFSHVGFKKQEIKPEGRGEIDVVLIEGVELGEVSVVGSRNVSRSVTETPVAVDVLNIAELRSSIGQFDVNQILQYSAPSFNANRQSGADGADHIDPATLRGLGPDQTLVLVNGKRRHQSSLINIFGSRGRGNTGTDLNAIPPSSIERIEILRDGASAQYGSDAIAGVVNVVLKSSIDEFTTSLSTGVHSTSLRTDRDYDGEEFQIGGNYGSSLGEEGFLSLSADYLRKGRTNRPADPATYSIFRNQFGDAILENFGFFFNSSVKVGEKASVYGFGGLNYRDTDAYAWTREPDSERNVPAIYPNGFDPRILSTITDPSLSLGLRTKLVGWDLDLNNTYGSNRFHFFVDGTLNASLLEKSPTRFDAGGFELTQNTTGANFTRLFPTVLEGLNVAFGAEFRIENYQIFAGDEGSYRNYGVVDTVINGYVTQRDTLGRPAGSQGFPGFRPANELEEFRTNIGTYIDAELDFTDQFMVAGALRYESYSDFGGTFDAKLASRLKIVKELALRGSISTGFRAPSLAQIHYNQTFTDFVAGVPIDKIIAKNNSPITRTLGIPPLKEETAVTATVGFTTTPFEGFTATVDGYYVKIEDRIVLTGAFDPDNSPEIAADLQALGVGAAQFFSNAIDTKSLGLDVILSYAFNLSENRFQISYAGNFNDMELGDIKTSPKLAGKEDIYFGRREQLFLLASAPFSKSTATLDYDRDRFHATARVNHFGRVTLEDFCGEDDVYHSKITLDLSAGFDITSNLTLILGGSNITDEYPDEQDPAATETGGLWDAVQMGFSGRFLYGRVLVNL